MGGSKKDWMIPAAILGTIATGGLAAPLLGAGAGAAAAGTAGAAGLGEAASAGLLGGLGGMGAEQAGILAAQNAGMGMGADLMTLQAAGTAGGGMATPFGLMSKMAGGMKSPMGKAGLGLLAQDDQQPAPFTPPPAPTGELPDWASLNEDEEKRKRLMLGLLAGGMQ